MSVTDGFGHYVFQHDGVDRKVYYSGTGRPVLVMHELPGLAEPAFNLARRLEAAGFQPHLPHLFGTLGRRQPLLNGARLCISREFGFLAAGTSSPVTHWLRALARDIAERTSSPRIGAIGMCLTGAFAIPLVLEPCVAAAVAAQPALPISWLHLSNAGAPGETARQLNVSDEEIAGAAVRLSSEGRSLLAFRFEEDRLCPAGRFARLAEELGESLESHVYEVDKGKAGWLKFRHSVLTEDADAAAPGSLTAAQTRAAFERLCAFLREQIDRA